MTKITPAYNSLTVLIHSFSYTQYFQFITGTSTVVRVFLL